MSCVDDCTVGEMAVLASALCVAGAALVPVARLYGRTIHIASRDCSAIGIGSIAGLAGSGAVVAGYESIRNGNTPGMKTVPLTIVITAAVLTVVGCLQGRTLRLAAKDGASIGLCAGFVCAGSISAYMLLWVFPQIRQEAEQLEQGQAAWHRGDVAEASQLLPVEAKIELITASFDWIERLLGQVRDLHTVMGNIEPTPELVRNAVLGIRQLQDIVETEVPHCRELLDPLPDELAQRLEAITRQRQGLRTLLARYENALAFWGELQVGGVSG